MKNLNLIKFGFFVR